MRFVLLTLILMPLITLNGCSVPSQTGTLWFGVHILSPEDATFRAARELGATWVIYPVLWRDIEPYPGRYAWAGLDLTVQAAEYYGLRLAVRVDHPPSWASGGEGNTPPRDPELYAEFVGKLAQRYAGRIKAYIIWNEPNLAQEWGGKAPNPESYVALLRAAYSRIKEADPQALVVSAGLASTNERSHQAMDDRLYLRRMYEAGAREFFDALGAHPYGFAYPPDDPRGSHQGLNMARLEELREIMVAFGDADKKVWVTEFGWTTEGYGEWTWAEVTEEVQARYLTQAVAMAAQKWPWVELMAVWNLMAGEEQPPAYRGFNLLRPDGSPKPAYKALQSLTRHALYLRREPPPPYPDTITILAPDQTVHLGDSEYPYPWEPLHLGQNPSPIWEGAFYVQRPCKGRWLLSLELFQSNEPGNFIAINGHRVTKPYLPVESWEGKWVVVDIEVPAEILREGRNRITISITKRPPPWQHGDLVWDDIQFRNVMLKRIRSARLWEVFSLLRPRGQFQLKSFQHLRERLSCELG